MRIHIQSANADPCSHLLLAVDEKNRPFCSLYEDDLTEILSEDQVMDRVKGIDQFDVPQHSLELIALTVFNVH